MVMEPAWKNIFENPTMAQFDHRILVRQLYSTAVVDTFAFERDKPRASASPLVYNRGHRLDCLLAGFGHILASFSFTHVPSWLSMPCSAWLVFRLAYNCCLS
jgi:hypothetical protein